MKKDITELYCFVDDFCQSANRCLGSYGIDTPVKRSRPTRICGMSLSEICTIVLMYNSSPCKHFKYFYESYLQLYKSEFPCLLSYNRFIEVKARAFPYLIILLQWFCDQSAQTGISYIDSTSLAVCHFKRISRHKVFEGIAELGKTTKGWFHGFKLHLIINEKGHPLSLKLTPGNTDDRAPVPSLTEGLKGFLFGDKGYIKQKLFETLYAQGLKLMTGIKKNMKNKLMTWHEKILLRKRSIIETVFSVLKGTFDIEHTRHRSVPNAFTHILAALVSYCLKNNKPAIKLHHLIPS